MKAAPMIGRVFGRLTVVSLARSTSLKKYWNCGCSCGASTVSDGEHLRSGRTVSCGCAKRSNATAMGRSNNRHGHSSAGGSRPSSREYTSWKSMHERCTSERHKSYPDYGGKGVTVCARWASFENFLADMGARPQRHSLDRIDPTGNYSPENCRWASASVQARNTRKAWAKAQKAAA